MLAAATPFLVNAIRAMLFIHFAKMLVGALAFLGLTIMVNNVVIDPIISGIQARMSQGPTGSFGATALQWLGVLQLDKAVSMLLSAYVIVNTIKTAKISLQKVGL
jgi:hypothetical protein